MLRPRNAILAMAALLAAGLCGCGRQTFSVVENLPDPSITPLPAEPARLEAWNDKAAEDAPAPAAAPGPHVPAEWVPAARPQHWKYLVIHHSGNAGGSAAAFDAFHRDRRQWDELGYHFVICNGNGGADGLVEVGSRWDKQKWGAHTGGTPTNEYNNYGIGICLVGAFHDRLPTERQLSELTRLTEFLAGRYGIAARNVLGHRDAPGSATDCPGDRLHEYVHRTLRPHLAKHHPHAGAE